MNENKPFMHYSEIIPVDLPIEEEIRPPHSEPVYELKISDLLKAPEIDFQELIKLDPAVAALLN